MKVYFTACSNYCTDFLLRYDLIDVVKEDWNDKSEEMRCCYADLLSDEEVESFFDDFYEFLRKYGNVIQIIQNHWLTYRHEFYRL